MAGLLARLFHRSPSGDPVVVVSGLPRSGTSMVMAMLRAGGLPLVTDGVRTADDDNPRGYYELERVKDLDKGGDKGWVAEAQGKGIKVISALLEHLPTAYHYKIIFVRRSVAEVLASQRKMLDRRGETGGTVDDAEMARLFDQHLRQVEVQLAARAGCEVLYLEHRDAVHSPRAVADAINRFLGDRLDAEAMAAAVDAQLYRNRERDAAPVKG